MKCKALILGLIFSMILSVPVFANPTNPAVETGDDVQIVVPDNITNAEAYTNLKKFQNLVNNKDIGNTPETIIRVVKVPKESDVANSGAITEGAETPVVSTEPVEEILHFSLFDGQTFFSVEDDEFKIWMDEIVATAKEDAVLGLQDLKNVTTTLDHIKLKNWGEFLTKYYGKEANNFPMGNVVITYGDYSFTFANSKECKEFILDYLVPPMVEAIVNESKSYPAKRYVLDIQSGSVLADYQCDLTKVKELKTVYPFDGVSNYIFSNTGDYFAINLGEEYVNILRGYIDESGYDRRVEGSVPGCVNVLSYVTLLRNVNGATLSDKVLSDFTMYENLAVCLDTKELIDTTDMTTNRKALVYADYKIDPSKLLLTPISDTVVIIQPTYLECFSYRVNANNKVYERNFGRTLDATEFITTGAPYLTTTVQVEGEKGSIAQKQQINLEYFTDEFGILDVRLGNAPFLIFYINYVPYDLLINWYYNDSTAFSLMPTEVERENFIKQVKNDMETQGRSAEFDAYVKAAGQMTDGTKTIMKVSVISVIVIVVAIVAFIIYKKVKYAKENPVTYRSKVLFDDDNDMDDDDDDDFGSFELK